MLQMAGKMHQIHEQYVLGMPLKLGHVSAA